MNRVMGLKQKKKGQSSMNKNTDLKNKRIVTPQKEGGGR